MQNKTVLITGATGGIGKQTALALAKMGASLVVTGRNRASGEEAVDEIRRASGNATVDLLLADLSIQADVRALAEQYKGKHERLDVLINNAGLAAAERQLTQDGIESNLAVNVIAPFLLTHLLLDFLKASSAGRVIGVMGGNLPATLDLSNLQAERSFDGLNSYSQSKLAMMIVMYEFAARMAGSSTTVNVCYPGRASTMMTRSVTADMLPGFMRLLYPVFKLAVRDDGGKSARKAARSSVYLASSPEVAGVSGKYFDANSKLADWSPAVFDEPLRTQLWSKVERLAQLT